MNYILVPDDGTEATFYGTLNGAGLALDAIKMKGVVKALTGNKAGQTVLGKGSDWFGLGTMCMVLAHEVGA